MKRFLLLLALTSLAYAQEPLLEIGRWLPEGVADFQVSPDGQRLLIFPHYYNDQDRNLELWRVSDGKRLAELHERAQHLNAAFAPGGKYVLAIAEEQITPAIYASRGYVWDLAGHPVGKPADVAGDIADQTVAPSPETVVVTNWSNQDNIDASGGSTWSEGLIQLWHWPTCKVRFLGKVQARLQGASVSPDGRWASTYSGDTMSGIWDTRTGKLVYRNFGNDGVSFSSIPGIAYTSKIIMALPSLRRMGRVPESVRREYSGKTFYSIARNSAKVLDPQSLKPLRKARLVASPGFEIEWARRVGRLSGDRLLLWDESHRATGILSP